MMPERPAQFLSRFEVPAFPPHRRCCITRRQRIIPKAILQVTWWAEPIVGIDCHAASLTGS